uniref:GABA type A receptor associated protein like 2 n=1 Tax=Equus caballus TaxID=9796 RepID=F7CYJ4_HORSE
MKWMFKEDHSLEHRCVESAKIRAKYPDRVPVIVEKVSGSQIVDIDKRKYLVPSDITVAQFMWIIRKRIQLPSEKAIFLFVDKTVPQSRMDANPASSSLIHFSGQETSKLTTDDWRASILSRHHGGNKG